MKTNATDHNCDLVIDVAIIGAGFAGICMSIKLLERKMTNFIVLERAASLGGTWRENTYPGAECDIASVLYSYSFEQNPEWNYKWSDQQQILEYQKHTASRYGVEDYIQFETGVESLTFDEVDHVWRIETSTGKTYQAKHVVSGIGQLHVPSYPQLDGSFAGKAFHSAVWDHDYDLGGKRVAVIGNGASALQFIPQIAQSASKLYVLQRSPNWVLPKLDRPFWNWEKALMAKLPSLVKIYRFSLWLKGEWVLLPAIKGNRFVRWALTKWSNLYLRKHIKSRELQEKLTPSYPMGAKRILLSDDYYAALARDNVELITDPIARLVEQGVEFEGGNITEVDAVIYATGFVTNPFMSQITVVGRDGVSLKQHWSGGAHAYFGISTHGFPNLHFMYGPNTNLGHNSIIIMLEAQAKAIRKLVELDYVEISESVEADFDHEMQSRLQKTAFAEVDKSWYKDGDRITNNWAGGTREYMRRVANIDISAYQNDV